MALGRFLLGFLNIFSKNRHSFFSLAIIGTARIHRWPPLRYNKWGASFWPVYQQVMMMILWLRNSGKRLLRPLGPFVAMSFNHQTGPGPCDGRFFYK